MCPTEPAKALAPILDAELWARRLLLWFDRHRRDLPWRRTRDPYGIWLSEVMLQQTRVETVIPYYERFLARFPTVEALAAAPLDDVLALWSGLGYYRRARQLHAAAGQVAATGGFPRTLEGLLALPGIGPYTAAAVASIAFDVAAPVLDGNVERVVSRLLALAQDPHRSGVRERLMAAAGALVDRRRPGDSNQALMELGATVCLPRQPRCLFCPLAGGCGALRAGDPERYPSPKQKRKSEKRRMVVAVVARGPKLLFYRRPDESDLLAGTWELPWVAPAAVAGGDPAPLSGDRVTAASDRAALAAALGVKYGGRWRLGEEVGRVKHGITHRDIEVVVVLSERTEEAGEVAEPRGEAGSCGRDSGGWFALEEVAGLATSSLVGKVLRQLGSFGPPGPGAAPGEARSRGRRASRSRSRRPG